MDNVGYDEPGTHSVPMGGGMDGLTQWETTIAGLLSDV